MLFNHLLTSDYQISSLLGMGSDQMQISKILNSSDMSSFDRGSSVGSHGHMRPLAGSLASKAL